jgi:hypothetical protein
VLLLLLPLLLFPLLPMHVIFSLLLLLEILQSLLWKKLFYHNLSHNKILPSDYHKLLHHRSRTRADGRARMKE